ncbi:hypothetical protein AVEN_203993-1 [Araneus ventricosus]|uniref:Uncharacterized protein n=1 Tax=Araneus ventricosus TaxID=182803 RepID=A0A4Y2P6H5_ARAVE|nr:hypothetical protein AVEN_203993-1 [Araneus ventricosus]
MAAAIFIRVVSRHGKATMRYWMKPLTAPSGAKRWSSCYYLQNCARLRREVNYKVVEYHGFSTNRHLMVMNAKNRTLKMHICLFAASETVTSRNLNERRKDYLSDRERATTSQGSISTL